MPKLLIIALTLAIALLPADARQATTRILFVGNSLTFWNYGLYVHLERFAASAEPSVSVTTGRSVVPGAFLKSLWLREEPRQAIATGNYDVVVLQEDLPETTVDDFQAHARLFVAAARKAGARPVLLMAWAYGRLGWITMDGIARAHREAAAELNVDVAPVRLAWQRASERRPALTLYAPDRASKPARTSSPLRWCTWSSLLGTRRAFRTRQPVSPLEMRSSCRTLPGKHYSRIARFPNASSKSWRFEAEPQNDQKPGVLDLYPLVSRWRDTYSQKRAASTSNRRLPTADYLTLNAISDRSARSWD